MPKSEKLRNVYKLENYKVIGITLKIQDNVLVMYDALYSCGVEPTGKMDHSKPVCSDAIGYWVDIVGDDNEVVLYRRYINNMLPINIPEFCKDWDRSRRESYCVRVDLPVIQGATAIKLYEQCYRSKQDMRPTKICHAVTNVNEIQ